MKESDFKQFSIKEKLYFTTIAFWGSIYSLAALIVLSILPIVGIILWEVYFLLIIVVIPIAVGIARNYNNKPLNVSIIKKRKKLSWRKIFLLNPTPKRNGDAMVHIVNDIIKKKTSIDVLSRFQETLKSIDRQNLANQVSLLKDTKEEIQNAIIEFLEFLKYKKELNENTFYELVYIREKLNSFIDDSEFYKINFLNLKEKKSDDDIKIIEEFKRSLNEGISELFAIRFSDEL